MSYVLTDFKTAVFWADSRVELLWVSTLEDPVDIFEEYKECTRGFDQSLEVEDLFYAPIDRMACAHYGSDPEDWDCDGNQTFTQLVRFLNC